jgi:hypothetical protein
MSVSIPCLECGTPSSTSRCPRHKLPERPKAPPSRRGYGRRWQMLSRLARNLHPWCSDCGALDDLTADHLRWPATSLADVEVVCRACNSARGPLRGAGLPLEGPSGSTRSESGISHSDPEGRP